MNHITKIQLILLLNEFIFFYIYLFITKFQYFISVLLKDKKNVIHDATITIKNIQPNIIFLFFNILNIYKSIITP